MDSISVCNLSTESRIDVANYGHPDFNDVKLAGELDEGGTRESMVCDDIDIAENREFNKSCCSDNFPDHKTSLSASVDERINEGMSDLRGDLKLLENVGFPIGKFEGSVEKCDDVSLCAEPTSPTMIKFPEDGMNLFVEVFGPLDGISEENSDVMEKVEDPLLEKNAMINHSSLKNEREVGTEDHEFSFDVGNLVWVKTDDVLSMSRFDPSSFFTCIQNFASSACLPGKIELSVVKNRLSMFHRSIGHLELPMHVLCAGDEVKVEGCDDSSKIREKSVRAKKKRTPSDYDDLASADKMSSNKGSESRDRKKSKFLSYPFVNEQRKQNPKHGLISTPKGSRKSVKVRHVVSKADDINAPSSELLTELRSAVCDPLYLYRSKYSDSLRRFYYSFRSILFLDVDVFDKEARAKKETNCEKTRPKNSCKQTKLRKKGTTALKEESEKPDSVLDSISKLPKMDNPGTKGSILCTSAEKMEQHVTCKAGKGQKKGTKALKNESEKSNLNLDLPNMDNLVTKGSALCTSEEQHVTSACVVEKSCPKSSCKVGKGSKKATIDFIKNLLVMDNPVAKGSALCTSEEKMEHGVEKSRPKAGKGTKKGAEAPKKEAENSTANLDSINNLTKMDNPEKTELKSPLVNDPRMTNFLQTCSILCKGKEKKNELISGLPDLNKNSPSPAEPVPPVGSIKFNGVDQLAFASVTPSSDLNRCQEGPASVNTEAAQFTPQLEQKGKGKEIKAFQIEKLDLDRELPRSDSSLCDGHLRKRSRKEDPGGSIVLKFAPGFTIPSTEILVGKLSRYGLVTASEIRALNETTVEIPYSRTPDVCFAHRSLESDHPFGPALVALELKCPHVKVDKRTRTSPGLKIGPPPKMAAWPTVGVPARPSMMGMVRAPPAGPGGALPDIAFMKQNVEMMKLTLEKMGDKIPPDARAKLEKEISGFLGKIGNFNAGPGLG